MKLEKEHIEYLQSLMTTASLIGIDSISIDANMTRGTVADITTFILEKENVLKLPVGSLSISRLPLLSSRMNIVQSDPKFTIETIDDIGFVKQLTLVGNRTKIDFRCVNPEHFRSPKKLNFEEDKYLFVVSDDAFDVIVKGERAMGADSITFSNISNNLLFSMKDPINKGESMVSELGSPVEETEDFSFTYPSKTIISVLKNNNVKLLSISNNGFLKVKINNFNVFVAPNA